MNNNSFRKLIFFFALVTTFSVISGNAISYMNFDKYNLEFVADMESESSQESETTDLSEDGDFLYCYSSMPSVYFELSGLPTDQYSHFDHIILGITTPPPELS